jgi:hypothetical protein
MSGMMNFLLPFLIARTFILRAAPQADANKDALVSSVGGITPAASYIAPVIVATTLADRESTIASLQSQIGTVSSQSISADTVIDNLNDSLVSGKVTDKDLTKVLPATFNQQQLAVLLTSSNRAGREKIKAILTGLPGVSPTSSPGAPVP